MAESDPEDHPKQVRLWDLATAKKFMLANTDKERDEDVDHALAEQRERIRRLGLENAKLELDHKDQEENREMRKRYSDLVFKYLVGYSVFVGVVVVLAGFEVLGFQLDTSVLDFLVGSTAASSIGLVAIVVRGLFNSNIDGNSL